MIESVNFVFMRNESLLQSSASKVDDIFLERILGRGRTRSVTCLKSGCCLTNTLISCFMISRYILNKFIQTYV